MQRGSDGNAEKRIIGGSGGLLVKCRPAEKRRVGCTAELINKPNAAKIWRMEALLRLC